MPNDHMIMAMLVALELEKGMKFQLTTARSSYSLKKTYRHFISGRTNHAAGHDVLPSLFL
jgi:hypothetical protein